MHWNCTSILLQVVSIFCQFYSKATILPVKQWILKNLVEKIAKMWPNKSCSFGQLLIFVCSRARERIHNVDFWMSSFLKNIGTVILEDGEEVLPTTMQPVTLDDFESYLAPYVGNTVRGPFINI